MSATESSPLRKAIYAALADENHLEIPEIHAEVSKTMRVSMDTVRRTITRLRQEGMLDAETDHRHHYKYFLGAERAIQRRISADRFKMPAKLRGPVVSPMAWIARQLGAV